MCGVDIMVEVRRWQKGSSISSKIKERYPITTGYLHVSL
jgi:hypothetical protein